MPGMSPGTSCFEEGMWEKKLLDGQEVAASVLAIHFESHEVHTSHTPLSHVKCFGQTGLLYGC